MHSFFNDLKNRDVIKVIASFLDFISLGKFLKASKIINMSCKEPFREEDPRKIYKSLEYYCRYNAGGIMFYDTKVIYASCFYKPVEVFICYKGLFNRLTGEHYFVIDDKKQGRYELYFEDGSIREERFYKDGFLIGSFRSYFEDGRINEDYSCEECEFI